MRGRAPGNTSRITRATRDALSHHQAGFEVAYALGYHRKTLVNHCSQAEFLPPHELLCWCRLAVAGELIATSCRSIESVALQLGFPSDTSLRNMMKRYTGMRASEVRERGGARCVVVALRRALPGEEGPHCMIG